MPAHHGLAVLAEVGTDHVEVKRLYLAYLQQYRWGHCTPEFLPSWTAQSVAAVWQQQ